MADINLTGIIAIAVCLIFTFVNGFHGGCNVMATAVSSRTMPPGKAIILAFIAEFFAPLILGTKVAETMGKGLIDLDRMIAAPYNVAIVLILIALISGIIWNLFTWKAGIPSSSSHALIGGLIGSGIAMFGIDMVNWSNFFWKVVFMLIVTPIIGFTAGFIFIKLVKAAVSKCHININLFFKKIQALGIIFLGSSLGTNDAQKSMGIIAIILLVCNPGNSFSIPFWAMAACAFALSSGLILGGWSIVKTVGMKIFRVKPIHSFNAQLAASSVIMAAGMLGSPISTTQVISSSIMGTGAGERISLVNWNIIRDIIISWVITIPSSAVISFIISFAFRKIFLKL